MAKKIFEVAQILDMRPHSWAITTENFIKTERVPYLRQFVNYCLIIGFSKEELIEAWAEMMEIKSEGKDFAKSSEDLTLGEALSVFFGLLNYSETKKHYLAFLELCN